MTQNVRIFPMEVDMPFQVKSLDIVKKEIYSLVEKVIEGQSKSAIFMEDLPRNYAVKGANRDYSLTLRLTSELPVLGPEEFELQVSVEAVSRKKRDEVYARVTDELHSLENRI